MSGDNKQQNDAEIKPKRQPNRPYGDKEDDGVKLWGVFVFGLIGATATTYAVGQLRRTVDWFYSQLFRSQSSKGGTSSSFRTSFQEEARRRYHRRMQEEYEEELERVERIRRMQNVFNREREKHRRGFESWREHSTGGYHQQYQREDWYWKTDTSFKNQGNHRQTPRETPKYSLSHHYAVLGLSRSRTKPYTDEEIKTAFRTKAKEFHPDQNLDNKEAAEAKFKEVMTSYEAIKSERKSIK